MPTARRIRVFMASSTVQPLRAPKVERAGSSPTIKSCLGVLAVIISVGAGVASDAKRPAVAESHGAEIGAPRRMAYDLPVQPLDSALDAFGAAGTLQVFYEASLTRGRNSAEVKGVFAPEEALQILLRGSGLAARVIAPNTISIAPEPGDGAGSDNAAARQLKRESARHFGAMQADLMQALCRNAITRPGSYRIAIQYWLDASGRIARLRLIGSSGNPDRDTAIAAALQNVVLRTPGNMPQPVTMTIEPSVPEQLAGCMPRHAGAGRAE
jgi:Secretin and TonB N terminus short domain